MTELLSKDHTILERGFMEHRPFGIDPHGENIRDVSGLTVKANVEYLEEAVGRRQGPEAGARVAEQLCQLLNERIRDPVYHVSSTFLKNVWHSYSYEFVCFLGEFCRRLSDDSHFQFHVGKEKFISPIIQTLGRPFTVSQIYKMFAHFGEKFAKGSLQFEVEVVTDGSAVLRMKFNERVYQQFGPYRKHCAELICQSAKAALAAVPERVHHLPAATIKDRTCIADGAEYCEWEFTWWPLQPRRSAWPVLGLLAGGAAFAYLRILYPEMPLVEALALALFPAMALWLINSWRTTRKNVQTREALIQEQLRFVEARHEELREAYLEQERTTVELRKMISQLTTLHRAGLLFSTTLDREALLQNVLQTIVRELHYDRAMVAFFDRDQRMLRDTRMLGVSEEVAAFARSLEVPVTDPNSVEGTVVLQGRSILAGNIRDVWDRLHPFHQRLALAANVTSMISVPLKTKDLVLGALTVDRSQKHSLTQDDANLLMTVASQVAIALDNADAYRQIESLNEGLEAKVRERTTELERLNKEQEVANERLRELDQLKSTFVSIVSHELRTPMTSIKGYMENMLDGLTGHLTEKQLSYLNRVKYNVERLTRMINDLLDLSRIEADRAELALRPVSLLELGTEVLESLQSLAREKSITLEACHHDLLPIIRGDRDKLHQILMNLIQNAIKFTPAGGEVRVESLVRGNEFVQISVADTGCGIQPEELAKVFEKFYRGESVPSDARGAGLGLAIVKSLVELHGGRIWVESTPCAGSRFSFTIPLDPIRNVIPHA